jgi:outer membrane lipoprotein carrier protein
MTRTWLTLVIAAALMTPLVAQTPSPDALARRLQQHYDGVAAFTADFVQTYKGGAFNRQSRAEGTVMIKKPGKMRWEFTRPERDRQLIVSDGVKIHVYSFEDKVHQQSNVPPDDEAPTAMLFLAGKGNVTRDFIASNTPSPQPGALALKLTPRESEADYEFLILVLDPATAQIREIHTRDLQGAEVRLSFSNMKENVNVADRNFSFTPPKDANVWRGDAPR